MIQTQTLLQTQVEPNDVRQKVKDTLTTHTESWYNLAKLLAEVYEDKMFKEWGFITFEDYTEEELQLGYRVAMYYVDCGRLIQSCKFTPDDLKGLTYTKFKELKSELENTGTLAEAKSIIKDAKNKSLREIQEEKRTKDDSKESSKDKHKKVFTFTPDQIEIIEVALREARERLNTDNESYALEAICAEYVSEITTFSDDIDESDLIDTDLFDEAL